MPECEFVYVNLRRTCHNKNGYNDSCYCRLHWKSVDGDSKMGMVQIERAVKQREIRECRENMGLRN